MFVRVVVNIKEGLFVNFNLFENEWEELYIVCWLYDCGKIMIFEFVVDKLIKLELIYDCIYEICMRFEVIKCEKEIDFLCCYVIINVNEID